MCDTEYQIELLEKLVKWYDNGPANEFFDNERGDRIWLEAKLFLRNRKMDELIKGLSNAKEGTNKNS